MGGVEAAGDGVATGRHAATITEGRAGVLHGAMSLLLQDGDGQVMEAHSISAGLDYPGVGPEHSYLREIGRAEYAAVTDQQALDALRLVSELEGIIPALETAHAFAWLEQLCPTLPQGTEVVINCSGRGDQDAVPPVARRPWRWRKPFALAPPEPPGHSPRSHSDRGPELRSRPVMRSGDVHCRSRPWAVRWSEPVHRVVHRLVPAAA